MEKVISWKGGSRGCTCAGAYFLTELYVKYEGRSDRVLFFFPFRWISVDRFGDACELTGYLNGDVDTGGFYWYVSVLFIYIRH